MSRSGTLAAAIALVLATAGAASAQIRLGRDTPSGGSWELGGGVTWTGGFTGPDRAAELTRNGEDSGGFDLFTASGEIETGAGVGATLGYYLSRSVALEAGFQYSKPRLTFQLTGDAEDAAPATAEETLTKYVFTGSVVWHLGRSTGRQLVPFLSGGAGYIRELHEGNEVVETGTEFHGTAGVKYWFGLARRRFGLRGEAGFAIVDGGFDFRDQSRTLPIASASLVYLF